MLGTVMLERIRIALGLSRDRPPGTGVSYHVAGTEAAAHRRTTTLQVCLFFRFLFGG